MKDAYCFTNLSLNTVFFIVGYTIQVVFDSSAVDPGENKDKHIGCSMKQKEKFTSTTYRWFRLLCPCGSKCFKPCADNCNLYGAFIQNSEVSCIYTSEDYDLKVSYLIKYLSEQHEGVWACEYYHNRTLLARDERTLSVSGTFLQK